MGKLEVITHPLIQHKLSILRRTDTSTKAFRDRFAHTRDASTPVT